MGNIRTKFVNDREDRCYEQNDIFLVPARDQVFRNELLADIIISELPISAVLKMREVCKLWKQISSPYALNRAPTAKLKNLEDSFLTAYPNLSERRKQVAKFVNNVVQSVEQMPFTKISVRLEHVSNFYTDVKLRMLIYGKLFPVLAKHVTELRVQYCDPIPMDWAVVKYPHLKSLIVDCSLIRNCGRNVIEYQKNIARIIEKASNLNSVDFDEGTEASSHNFLLLAVQKLANSNIKHFRFCGKVEKVLVIALLNLKRDSLLTLTLECDFEPDFPHSILFNQFLYSQKASVQKLKLRFPETVSMRFALPEMKNLTELEIDNCKKIIFMRLNVSQRFPVLKSLKLYDYKSTGFESLFIYPQDPCLTLQSLELPLHFSDNSILLKSTEVFPNIKSLKAPGYLLYKITTRLGWETLERLTVVGYTAEPALVNMARGTNATFLAKLKYLNFIQCHVSIEFFNVVVPALESLECLDFNEVTFNDFTMDKAMTVYWNMRKKFVVKNWFPNVGRHFQFDRWYRSTQVQLPRGFNRLQFFANLRKNGANIELL